MYSAILHKKWTHCSFHIHTIASHDDNNVRLYSTVTPCYFVACSVCSVSKLWSLLLIMMMVMKNGCERSNPPSAFVSALCVGVHISCISFHLYLSTFWQYYFPLCDFQPARNGTKTHDFGSTEHLVKSLNFFGDIIFTSVIFSKCETVWKLLISD